MRKFNVLGLAIFLATNAVMHGQDAKHLSDREIQRKLTGTWFTTWGKGYTTTNIIAADGSFGSQTVGLPKGQTVKYNGTFLAKDGVVVGKAIIGKQTVNMRLNIIRLDSHELVWSNEAGANVSTFHKVGG